VRAVTDPDPITQNRKRAEEAKRIVTGRVKVTNDISGTVLQTLPVDVWNWVTDNGNLKTRGQIIDHARAQNWDLAKVAWIIQAGQCDEHSSLMQYILKSAGVDNVVIFRSAGPHAWPVVNLAPDADPDIPWTWGPNAFVPDSWSGETLTPEQTWGESLYFDNGKKFVFSGRERRATTTRELLMKYVREGNDFIKQHCVEYQELLSRQN
jgi:hypothetical protein